MGRQPANDNETCPDCGGRDLHWVRDNGWLTASMRHLRCARCGYGLKSRIPARTWAMYAIALAAAVWGWIVVVGGKP